MQLTPCLRENWRMMREVGIEVCDWWFRLEWAGKCVYRKVCVCACVWERVRVCVHKHKPVCSAENRTRQQIPAASVADKLQGLAGTSGAQVALSIQDRAHWSVVWAGAGANSWTLALSAPHEGGGRRAEVGERLAGYKWRHPQTLLDLRLRAYQTAYQLSSPISTAWLIEAHQKRQPVQRIYYKCHQCNSVFT